MNTGEIRREIYQNLMLNGYNLNWDGAYKLPKTIEEARTQFHRIIPDRYTKHKDTLSELKEISRNLGLDPSGSKIVLISRIQTHVMY